MIWVDKIRDLQHYHQSDSQYCYCDLILFATDLTLQAQISKVTGASTCEIYQYTPDGVQSVADITSSFQWYTTTDGQGNYYWTAKMTTISPACLNPCFILRVVIKEGNTVLWDKFTERYCIQSCCVPVSSVTYTQDGYTPVTLHADVFSNESGFGYIINQCGKQVVAMIGTGTCLNRANGYYYGSGSKISGSGDAFKFYQVTNMYATAQILPREIVRTISRNCRTQEVERVQRFKIQGQEPLPLWKVQDLEDLFTSENFEIYTDSTPGMGRVVLDTTTAFETIGKRNVDQKYDRFKMDFEVRQCREFQMFGCSEVCPTVETTTYGFVIPSNAESYYSEGGELIATDPEELVTWLRSIDQTTDAYIVNLSPPSSTWNIFVVAGNGYLPTSLYINNYNYENKIVAIPVTTNTPDWTSYFPEVPCSTPVIGTIASETIVCPAPTIGGVTSEVINETSGTIMQYQAWVQNSAETSLLRLGETTVVFSLEVFNSSYPVGSISPYIIPNLSGEIIAVLPEGFRPTTNQLYGHNNYDSIPEDASVIISPTGYIVYSGPVSDADETGSTITLTNIQYYL